MVAGRRLVAYVVVRIDQLLCSRRYTPTRFTFLTVIEPTPNDTVIGTVVLRLPKRLLIRLVTVYREPLAVAL